MYMYVKCTHLHVNNCPVQVLYVVMFTFTWSVCIQTLSFFFSLICINSTEKFHVMGVKINTPHYLAKLENVPRGSSSYTVIVSQLESLSAIYYTLRVSTCICTCVLKYLYMYMYSLFQVITNGPESIKQSLRPN